MVCTIKNVKTLLLVTDSSLLRYVRGISMQTTFHNASTPEINFSSSRTDQGQRFDGGKEHGFHTRTPLGKSLLSNPLNIYPTRLSNHGPNIHQNCPNIATLLTALYTISISVAEFKASHRTVTSLCSFLLYCVALLVTTGSQNARFSPGKQENNVKHDGLDGPNTRCLEKTQIKTYFRKELKTEKGPMGSVLI